MTGCFANQLIPARGRKPPSPYPQDNPSRINSSPQGDGNTAETKREAELLANQLIPARGRKLRISHLLTFFFIESTHPRKGTETSIVHPSAADSPESTHPRKGTETLYLGKSSLHMVNQLIPARGRKLSIHQKQVQYKRGINSM